MKVRRSKLSHTLVPGVTIALTLGCRSPDRGDGAEAAEQAEADGSEGDGDSVPGDGDGIPGDGDGDPDGDGDGDTGDGDGEPGDGDGEPGDGDGEGNDFCDVTQFESIAPLWLEEKPATLAGTPLLFGVMVDDSGVLAVGRYQEDGGFLERLTLMGESEWLVDEPLMTRFISDDDTHVYFWTSDGLQIRRRARTDGSADDWHVSVFITNVTLNASGPNLLVSGKWPNEFPENRPAIGDAKFEWYSKVDATPLGEIQIGVEGINEGGSVIIPVSSGGHVAEITATQQPTTRLYGMDGFAMDTQLELVPQGETRFMLERPGGFLLAGNEAVAVGTGRSWVGSIDDAGQEQWRKQIAPCGPRVKTSLGPAAASTDGVWAVTRVSTGPYVENHEDLLVRFTWDGELDATYRFDAPKSGFGFTISDIAANDETIVIGGGSTEDDGTLTSWVARLR